MKDESVTDALLRQFLLDKVNEEERERIEGLFLTDSTMRERVLAVEQDLIEDYLEDSLSSTDRERFVLRYAQTAEQQRKLRITRSIKDWAIAEDAARASQVGHTTAVGQPGPATSSKWSRFWERLGLRPVFMLPIAAVIILAMVFAFLWLNRRTEQRRQFAIEQEVARLNSPSGLREVPPEMAPLTLNPLTLRGAPAADEINLRSGVSTAELSLLRIQSERYPKYEAVVSRYGGDETFKARELQLDDDGKTIRLRVPMRLLTRGLYQIQLIGIAADGSTSPVEQYQFTVID